jgi:hypothetical protein
MNQLQKINEKLVINIDDNTYELDVYGTWKEPWLVANQCGEILGLSNIHYNLQRVKVEWKRTLSLPYSSSNNSNTTLIYIKALYRIILRMNDNQFAEKFQDMVYDMIEQKRLQNNNNNQIDIERRQQHIVSINQQGLTILQQIGMLDDRTKSLIQNNILNVLNPPMIEYKEDNNIEEISLSKRVLDLFGFRLDAYNHHSILCSIGGKLRREYIKYYNRQPMKRNQYVHGTLRNVCHYTKKEWEECLDRILYAHQHLFRKH